MPGDEFDASDGCVPWNIVAHLASSSSMVHVTYSYMALTPFHALFIGYMIFYTCNFWILVAFAHFSKVFCRGGEECDLGSVHRY